MHEFFILKQDTLRTDLPIIDDYPDEIDVMDFISGTKVYLTRVPVEMTLSEFGGDFRPDIMTYLLPLFSQKMKMALDSVAVDNVDYYPVSLRNLKTAVTEENYWLANIVGVLCCLDFDASDATKTLSENNYRLKSFKLDESKTGSSRLFRLGEASELIIVRDDLKDRLDEYRLEGIRLIRTEDYDGY